MIERVAREKGERLAYSVVADAARGDADPDRARAAEGRASCAGPSEVRAAVAYRPAPWATLASTQPGKVHPVELCRALQAVLATRPNAILVCDGGEIGQWPQALLAPSRRLINGPAASIGASIPFAIAARASDPAAPVIAVMGDGTFGFHMAEFDTAVRYGLPFVAVVGNDAAWNAEHQIQLREYGAEPRPRLRAAALALRPGGAGARRPRRAGHGRRRACPGARARARQRQARLRQRHDRARPGAEHPTLVQRHKSAHFLRDGGGGNQGTPP